MAFSDPLDAWEIPCRGRRDRSDRAPVIEMTAHLNDEQVYVVVDVAPGPGANPASAFNPARARFRMADRGPEQRAASINFVISCRGASRRSMRNVTPRPVGAMAD